MSSGNKQKLKLTPFTVDEGGSISIEDAKSFTVQLNPSSYSHSYSISYSNKTVQGQVGASAKFGGVEPEKVSFDVLVDGTGVVPGSSSAGDVKTQIKKIKDVVYKYDGNNHEPNYVRLLWGGLLFFGRLTSLSIEYTLFKPSGAPLRAKLKLEFSSYISQEEEALKANRSSPDLSHLIVFKEGDTLPLLCHRVYKDSSYYLDVARINGIGNIRGIKPGTTLHFPPLR